MSENHWTKQGKTYFFEAAGTRLGVYEDDLQMDSMAFLEPALAIHLQYHQSGARDMYLRIPVRIVKDLIQGAQSDEVLQLKGELEIAREMIAHLELDLSEIRKPIYERSTAELSPRERDVLKSLHLWLAQPHGMAMTYEVRTLYVLYERIATEISVLHEEVARAQRAARRAKKRRADVTKLARRYRDEAGNEHTRADEALLDLGRETGRACADQRETMARYFEHIAQIDIGTVLTPQGRELMGMVGGWIRKGLDLEWERERLLGLEKTNPRAFVLGNSWEERIIMFGGHTPVCEKMHYEDCACSCGRDGWEASLAKLAEEARLNKEAMKEEAEPPLKVEYKLTDPYNTPFTPGVYRHWKGGLYHALMVAEQNEMTEERILVVVYLSMTTGVWHTRPLRDARYDSFSDTVHLSDGKIKRRFEWVGVQPIPLEL
jgi:hypothetical protein